MFSNATSPLPRKLIVGTARACLGGLLFVLGMLTGLRWEVRGQVKLAREPILIASKHQSALETLVLQHVLENPAIILKSELLSVPVLGWILRRLGHIGADRSGDLEGARQLLVAARQALREGRAVVIFPEGTRRDVGAPPDYKAGVELLYATLKVPCVPVAVNSGRVWPGKAWLPRRGRAVIEFLPPIEAGLPRAIFAERLAREIEAATARLLDLPK